VSTHHLTLDIRRLFIAGDIRGGDIAITSRPADGTRATVRLPCAECPGGTGE